MTDDGLQGIALAIIVGETASGKSALAIALAQRLNGEIVSADALAVYRDMEIGTAVPAESERGGIPHHCLAYINPSEGCDVQRWLNDAEAAIADIHARGKLPIVAGGTPLYVKSLLEGLSAGPPKDEATRMALQERYNNEGGEALLAELQRIDPDYASERHPNDARRIVRALEVHQLTGQPYSSFHVTDGIRRQDYDTQLIGLRWDKEAIHRRINARSKAMFAAGLVEEVKRLRAGLSKQAREGVGYKEVIEFLDGAYDREHCIYQVQKHSRYLAKKQRTWYKRWRDIHWLPGDAKDLLEQAESLLRQRFAIIEQSH